MDWNTGVMPYGDRWRSRRRILHQTFNVKVIGEHFPAIIAQAKAFLTRMHNDPKSFRKHTNLYSAGTMMAIAYAYNVVNDDEYVRVAEEATEMAARSIFPGAVAVNAIPMLRHLPEWFPGAGFQKYARECRVLSYKARNDPLNLVKEKMAAGTALSSVATSLLESGDPSIDEELVTDVTAISYVAGSDTLLSAITSCILALVIHPEVQYRAQAEIDHVIGRDRLPTPHDRRSMPYIEAICREILRWRVITPLGLLRSSMQDDIYDRWFIPKGTILFWNVWAMAHNPEVYPDPDCFKPERWLDDNGKLIAEEFDPVFGFGRRSCIGIYLAKKHVMDSGRIHARGI